MPRSNLTIISLALLIASGCAAGGNRGGEVGDDGIDGTGDGDGETDGETDDEEGSDEDKYEPNTGEGPWSCGDITTAVDEVPANVMLVLDKSGTMKANTWDHDGDDKTVEITRWASLHDVVVRILDGFEDGINFGATLFPSMDAGQDPREPVQTCLVNEDPEVAVGPDSKDAILAAIPGRDATDFGGGTPAAEGVLTAMNSLLDTEDDDALRAIVLVTDGAANCAPDHEDDYDYFDERLIGHVTDARAMDVRTFVVGVDIPQTPEAGKIDTYAKLNLVAEAGGMANQGSEKFYNALSHAQLQDALDDIAARVECSIPVDQQPPARWLIDVTVGAEDFSEVTDCDADNGWTLDDAGFRLCGEACDRYQDGEVFDAHFGCPPEG